MVYGENDRGPTLNAVSWGLAAVATVFVSLRILSRTVLSKFNAGLDDFFTLFALAVIIAVAVVASIAIDAGLGRHITDLSPQKQSDAVYKLSILNSIGVWTYALPKLAMVALLQRIFNLNKGVLIFFWTLCGICLILTMAISVLWFEQCRPVAHQWNPVQVPGTCLPKHVIVDLAYFTSAYSAFLDLLFALYPQYIIFNLNMRLSKKIAVGSAIGLSAIGTIVASYKMALFPTLKKSMDPTWDLVPLQLWGIVETDVLLVSASLPTIGPLIRTVKEQTSKLYKMSMTRSRRTGASEEPQSMGTKGTETTRGGDFKPLSSTDDIALRDVTWQGKSDEEQGLPQTSLPRPIGGPAYDW